MNNRTFLIITLIVFLPVTLFSQQIDAVILKNGTTIRGSIVEMSPDKTVTINDLSGNTWVYEMSDVEQLKKVENDFLGTIVKTEPGFVNMTSIGFLAGSQNSQYIAPFSMMTSFGYRQANGFYSGVTAGIEFLNINHIPLMVDLQYALRNGQGVTPIVIARGGYALPTKTREEIYGTTNTYSGGFASALGMGLRIFKQNGFAWDISLLYRYMRINYTEEYEYQNYDSKYTDIYNRLELRFGFYLGI